MISILKLRLIIILIAFCITYFNYSLAEEINFDTSSFFPSGIDFSKIENIDHRAQAWAMCSTLYKVAANINEIGSSVIRAEYSEKAKSLFFITAVTKGSDKNIAIKDQKDSSQVTLSSIDFLKQSGKKIQNTLQGFLRNNDRVGAASLIVNSLNVCDSNMNEASKVYEEFLFTAKKEGTSENILADTLFTEIGFVKFE